MNPVKVGICGLGTVGGGTFNVLKRNAEEIARRAGRGIQVAQIAMRTPNPQCDITGTPITNDVFAVATNPEIDIVIELIGGYTIARELVLKAIENGKHVVTANKALIAVHGNEIFAKAQEKGVIVAFEAAVAGGIPVIKAIREGLSANRNASRTALERPMLATSSPASSRYCGMPGSAGRSCCGNRRLRPLAIGSIRPIHSTANARLNAVCRYTTRCAGPRLVWASWSASER